MGLKLCYFSFFVLVYDWMRLEINGEKVIGLEGGGGLDDEDGELRLTQKRLQKVIDPLMRRSLLDKNFMRFGKRGDEKMMRKFNVDDKLGLTDDEHDLEEIFKMARPDLKIISDDSDNKPKRVKQDFIRFGRGKQDFIRFGRGKQDFIRFGRNDVNDINPYGVMGYQNPKTETELRAGSLSPDLEEVFSTDFGRNDDLERNPRAKNSFIRFGRADNFIRFGRNLEVGVPADNISYRAKRADEELRYPRDGATVPALIVADINPVEIRRSSGFMRLGRGDGNDRDYSMQQSKGLEPATATQVRRKRSVSDSGLEEKPKIGFKGIVVVHPSDSEVVQDKSENEESNTEKNELNASLPTESSDKSFHIPSIRNKRQTFHLEQIPTRLVKQQLASVPASPLSIPAANSLFNALTRSPEYYSIPINLIKSKPTSSKDYFVKVA